MYSIERHPSIQLNAKVDYPVGERQEASVDAILKRFQKWPGQILADEVGMGKTYVALAVATSVALSSDTQQPVVIMVPAGLMDKWPADFEAFKEHCLPGSIAENLIGRRANNAVEFLKLLDDPPERRCQVIFLRNTALTLALHDYWVKMAIIKRAMHRRRNLGDLRKAIDRFLPRLVGLSREGKRHPGMIQEMYHADFDRWWPIANRHGFDAMQDDPVPQAVQNALFKVLDRSHFDDLFDALNENVPRRKSKNIDNRLRLIELRIKELSREIWTHCAGEIPNNLPLLILDEAHHTRNARTKLARMFHESGQDDAGQLSDVFDRMLFLTATPFQLGHRELCQILERFEGINWGGPRAPGVTRQAFHSAVSALHASLDASQLEAVKLDREWGCLGPEDRRVDGILMDDEEQWWAACQDASGLTYQQARALEAVSRTRNAMSHAGQQLRQWVVRHIRERELEDGVARRVRYSGHRIWQPLDVAAPDDALGTVQGLGIGKDDVLPFLLAARHAVKEQGQRAVFAEGLASRYPTSLRTRQEDASESLDQDDGAEGRDGQESGWYLDHMERLIQQKSRSHPKLEATVAKAMEIWEGGEHALVFCHFVQTGRELRRAISDAIEKRIQQLGAQVLKCPQGEVEERLERMGNQFHSEGRGARLKSTFERLIRPLLERHSDIERDEYDVILDAMFRFLRTPSFLVRYFDLGTGIIDERGLEKALTRVPRQRVKGESLMATLAAFIESQARYSIRENRVGLMRKLDAMQSGRIRVVEESGSTTLPNVRLVNGSTKAQTRRNLMDTFNTPFFPEVLVASAVMAEGVDLHRNCCHVIHHDLCWSPSTLEQRTGRVDRIRSKGERTNRSVEVYLPFIAATQDEKMYRVVMDRERWFNVVMGDRYETDTGSTDRMADRIPLPQAVVDALAFDLRVFGEGAPQTRSQNDKARPH